jgi:hypothetical protein
VYLLVWAEYTKFLRGRQDLPFNFVHFGHAYRPNGFRIDLLLEQRIIHSAIFNTFPQLILVSKLMFS